MRHQNLFFIFLILILCMGTNFAGYYSKNPFVIKERLTCKQRRLLKHSLAFFYDISMPMGDNSLIYSNGSNYGLEFKKRIYRSLTSYTAFSTGTYNALNKLGVYQNDLTFDEISDVVFNKYNLITGLKLYIPLKPKLSLTAQLGTGFAINSFAITITPEGTAEAASAFEAELNTFLSANKYITDGFHFAYEYGAGIEWLMFYRVSLAVNYTLFNEISDGIKVNQNIGFYLTYYFEDLYFGEDLFK